MWRSWQGTPLLPHPNTGSVSGWAATADLTDYKLKIKAAVCFSLKTQQKEYYHNSSFLEHGGSPEKAFRSAFVYQINAYLKANNKYAKSDGQINISGCGGLPDLCGVLLLHQHFYENQTKKAITNKFIQEAMTDFFSIAGNLLY